NIAIIPKGLDVCLGQRTVLLRPNEDIVEPRFLCYRILSQDIQNDMHSRGGGSTVSHLNVKEIKNLKISLPPLETQKKIASILSGYDDLIENNLKRIKILEEMAQQTFVSFTQSDNKKLWKSVPLENMIDFHIGGGWGEEEQNEESSEAGYVIRG